MAERGETTRVFEGRPPQFPDGNPKTQFGLAKVPMRLAPASARIEMALAFKDGARKYGPYNWREKGITATVYLDAAQRHLDAWLDGEETADDSGVSHLGHALACIAIIIDAKEVGKLNDDRPPPGNAPEMQRRYKEDIPELKPPEAVKVQVSEDAAIARRPFQDLWDSFVGKTAWAYIPQGDKSKAVLHRWRDGQLRYAGDLEYHVVRGEIQLFSCKQDLSHMPPEDKPFDMGSWQIPLPNPARPILEGRDA